MSERLPPGPRNICGFNAVIFAISTGSVRYWPIKGLVLFPYILVDAWVTIWLRSTITDTAPFAEGFDTLWVLAGAVNVFADQLSRKNPCVAATAGSCPTTIVPPGPVPTPVPVVVVVVVLLSVPCWAFGGFLHDCNPANAVKMIAAINLMFFMFKYFYSPITLAAELPSLHFGP